jgi:hypothetical protein
MSDVDLISFWASYDPTEAPFVPEADLDVLGSERSRSASVTLSGWREAIAQENFCRPGDRRLHLGLLPMPFVGDLRRATTYLLLLNPGLSPSDYYGEYEVPAYRDALLRNLRQEQHTTEPFVFLDPQFAWHSGFRWWHRKLAGLITHLSEAWKVNFAEARSRVGSRVAAIEMVPYHSESFKDAGSWVRDLPSARAARAFVRDTVMRRVRAGEAAVVVTRQAEHWGIAEEGGVVVYRGAEAQGAHLTPKSKGGQAILDHLGVE